MESNVDANKINSIGTCSNKINLNNITTCNNITLNSMLTDITAMREEFLHCGKVLFQNNEVSCITDAACESDTYFYGNTVTVSSSQKSVPLLWTSHTTSADKSSVWTINNHESNDSKITTSLIKMHIDSGSNAILATLTHLLHNAVCQFSNVGNTCGG